MSSFFITGTDTDVGKTTACRAIIQALQSRGVNIVGFKPIACNAEESIYPTVREQNVISDYDNKENTDVLVLMNSTKQSVTYEEINSYTFNHSLPMLVESKSRIKLDKINAMLDKLCQKYQSVAVEGAFGLLTPMTEGKGFADWVKEQKMPIVLVVGIKDGCISHALLTVQAIRSLGVPLLGWVANRINPLLGHYAEIIDFLEKNIDAPLLGKIPYLHKPETQELGQYLTNIDRLLYMQTEQVK
ncbi:dethiobiotin synthase [Rodentibacter trehalosifermentans]|uniref:ATP-dependent dethiobiotin synthetase BioD n=1 Tax=Rodentibacter trehalosifermentans TaxID=1908263 RepID=A0A1V3IUH4_9PAST|nr:dethiobiotin synthase [Rodentibacter trehalosifermentans]OOF45690.1 dethiobiotin synthase [Rodentibacter trehalosifermentans]OOF48599.1 dethiobiotin synthase [Rodentibacter trehalosifermentans]